MQEEFDKAYWLDGIPHVDTKTAARLLDVHVGSLANQRSQQRSELRFTRVGSTILYRLSDVRERALVGA